MDNKLTEKSILDQENKLYSAIKDGNITVLDRFLVVTCYSFSQAGKQ